MSDDLSPNGLLSDASVKLEVYRNQITTAQKEYADLEFSKIREIWHPVRRVLSYQFDDFESLAMHKDLSLSSFNQHFPFQSNYDLDRHFAESEEIDECMFSLIRLDSLEDGKIRNKALRRMKSFSDVREMRQRKAKRFQRSFLAYQRKLEEAQSVHRYPRKGGTVVQILLVLLDDLDKEFSS